MNNKIYACSAVCVLFLGFACAKESAEEVSMYSGYRNDGSGIYEKADPVIVWSLKKNVIWEAKVGSGFASPIVIKDRVFVLSEPNIITCINKVDGKVLWKNIVSEKDLPPEVAKNFKTIIAEYGYAIATPVADGRGVYVTLSSGLVACFENTGKRKWIKYFGYPVEAGYGRASSPVFSGGKLIISIGHIIALDPETGNVLWETPEAVSAIPSLICIKLGKTEKVLTGTGYLIDPADGRILLKNIGNSGYTSPVFIGNKAYFIGGECSAVKLGIDKDNKVFAEKIWENSISGSEICASPLIYGGRIYNLTSDGYAFILNEKTGEFILKNYNIQEKVPHQSYMSPTLAGNYIFIGNDLGLTAVVKPGDKFEILKLNQLGNSSGSTHYFEGDMIYARGGESLFCLGITFHPFIQ